tara:strand:- start:294 stop:872 length:579 start_codon:yes stop_codon:yes gene_type:complete
MYYRTKTFTIKAMNPRFGTTPRRCDEFVINYYMIDGSTSREVIVKGTDTVADLFYLTGLGIRELGFELFISPTMKRLVRTSTLASNDIKEGSHIYVLPVNKPKNFESIEESLRKIREMELMEHCQMAWMIEDHQKNMISQQQKILDDITTRRVSNVVSLTKKEEAAAGKQKTEKELLAEENAELEAYLKLSW